MAASPIPYEQAVSPVAGARGLRRRFRGMLGALRAAAWWTRQPVPARVGWSAAAVAVVLVGLLLPVGAGAHRGDGVFTLAEGRWLSDRAVAMLPDASIVGVADWQAWRMTPDGQRSLIPGFGGTGVDVAADGSVLAIQGRVDNSPHEDLFFPPRVGEHRIVRWTPGVGVSVVAGTGTKGFGGDGGPATDARLHLAPSRHGGGESAPTGIVARPDGGFVFTDTGNGRVRAVDAVGVIRTIAGGAKGTLRDPIGLAPTADGGYLVTEAGWPGVGQNGLAARVRRIRPDGAIETVGRWSAQDISVGADGTAIVKTWDRQLSRLKPGSRTLLPFLRPERPTDTFDFAARSTFAWSVAHDRHGGVLVGGSVGGGYVAALRASGPVLRYAPNGPTPWTLAALRSTRTSRRAVAAVIETTQPGTATLEIARDERIVARVSQQVAAGRSRLRATGPIRQDWYEVRLRLEGASGAIARDNVPIHGARALTVPLARRILGRYQGREHGYISYRLGRDCRRFGKRRVDCVVTREDRSTVGVASVNLGRSGVVLRRGYEWERRGFRSRPRFNDSQGVWLLTRDDMINWPWPG